MNSAIFSLLKPTNSQDRSWNAACSGARDSLKTTKGIEELGEGTWLLHGEKSLPYLGQLASCAEGENCPYKIIVFQDGVEWSRTF